MRTETAPIVRLEDYRPTDFLIDTVALDVLLDPTATKVRAELSLRRNPAGQADAPLVLQGDELSLASIALDGTPLASERYQADAQGLIVRGPLPESFSLTVETVVNPSSNTKLMGLYRSGGNYCTQCEADGFRRITYFLDRPDVLSVYTTRLEAERADAPLLLANGNLVERGDIPGSTHHYAIWHDPHPKPAYLFALVGGTLDTLAEDFVTASGRKVQIAIHVEAGKRDRAAYALDALKRSMRWDEKAFGREYDLDVFNVVAVSDFNMGAMENKGLNIFNDKYVLASSDTATDADYAGIETVIAHEYFHNWTGNRITCRDWFQLCLKEGLTVFRDQEFSSDERSRPVKRIADVRTLRTQQFAEDSGPLSHPVRPRTYREINNFYTATVYEKGAEIVRMLRALIGAAAFRRGMDLYFNRYDGTAATIEDFLGCFAEASGRDLAHFSQWYEQAGTPVVTASGQYEASNGTYRLTLRQVTPPTPGQPTKVPMVIPVVLGLVGASGDKLPIVTTNEASVDENGLFVLDKETATITFTGLPERPVPSLLRGFSAPVRLEASLSDDDLLVLFSHDSDPFNQWQAGQTLATRHIRAAMRGENLEAAFGKGLGHFLDQHATQDPAFAAQVLALPSEADIARDIGRDINPTAIHEARRAVKRALGAELAPRLKALHAALQSSGAYSPDAGSAGRRSLRNTALDLLAAGDPAEGEMLAVGQFEHADNMTERFGALAVLALIPGKAREEALAAFASRYRDNPLVLDKWFALQAAIPEEDILDRIAELARHPAFSMGNPNRIRSLYGSFAMTNATQFNREDGRGYDLIADTVLALDPRNPQVAARLLTAFRTWRILEPVRRGKAEAALRRVAATQGLSPDVSDIAGRSLD
ncbi:MULTISPECIES: aminopeptidase N [unclassified Chelatococcus]|uniref:aminopeptidase N n=1 Tax=unclassified Chelatococcus TaxID=2638111 RepID=UPI001BCCFA48|nr:MULTISPECIES: aminopeptidase N [unclassified Chelatococcus]MBS7698487.1 aminopeptidase N [Chelatococcus sp. YT9]MBX3554862.1 aminopeptidase N [Chelatococcus sp.]